VQYVPSGTVKVVITSPYSPKVSARNDKMFLQNMK
jgi:hypothetical protein